MRLTCLKVKSGCSLLPGADSPRAGELQGVGAADNIDTAGLDNNWLTTGLLEFVILLSGDKFNRESCFLACNRLNSSLILA